MQLLGDICGTEVKGLSYKCNICPFWFHQNCSVLLPSTVEHSRHHHPLTLVRSKPPEDKGRDCSICYKRLSTFHCIYCCQGCLFCAHVSCAGSDETPQLPRDQLDGQHPTLPPVQQKSTDLISWFAETYRDRDPITNLILGFAESHIDPDTDKQEEIKFFGHNRPLFLIDDQVSEKICDACAQPISNPFYGCMECCYFLHKCCTELPKQITHPAHPQHQISLCPWFELFECDCCSQWSNGFAYACFQCQKFRIDNKCASVLRTVKHEAHEHPLIPFNSSSDDCSARGLKVQFPYWLLKCNMCAFKLCFRCAMAPPEMIHRYDKHPFKLTDSPPENHYNEYICELCLRELKPKFWHYHCLDCDQFTHLHCMLLSGADSNIKYGKTYKFIDHEHKLTLIRCAYDWFPCSYCDLPLRNNFSVALECVQHCKFRIHLECSFYGAV